MLILALIAFAIVIACLAFALGLSLVFNVAYVAAALEFKETTARFQQRIIELNVELDTAAAVHQSQENELSFASGMIDQLRFDLAHPPAIG